MSHHSFESLHLFPSTDLLCTLQSRFCSWFVCRCVRNDMPLDNLTENVKFILTSECTINVIHMHWNDCNDETTTENADGNCTPYYVVFMDCMQLRRGTVHTSHTLATPIAADEWKTIVECVVYFGMFVCWRRCGLLRRRPVICEIVSLIAIEWQSISFLEFNILWRYLFDRKPPTIDCAFAHHKIKCTQTIFRQTHPKGYFVYL